MHVLMLIIDVQMTLVNLKSTGTDTVFYFQLSSVQANFIFITFTCGILGQVWYLIVSIPDLCLLSHFGLLEIFKLNREYCFYFQ